MDVKAGGSRRLQWWSVALSPLKNSSFSKLNNSLLPQCWGGDGRPCLRLEALTLMTIINSGTVLHDWSNIWTVNVHMFHSITVFNIFNYFEGDADDNYIITPTHMHPLHNNNMHIMHIMQYIKSCVILISEWAWESEIPPTAILYSIDFTSKICFCLPWDMSHVMTDNKIMSYVTEYSCQSLLSCKLWKVWLFARGLLLTVYLPSITLLSKYSTAVVNYIFWG